jgi:XTP/dITP diphosphohydrolase
MLDLSPHPNLTSAFSPCATACDQAGLGPVTSLIIATRNIHKAQEIRAALGSGFRYLTLLDFPAAPAVQENADSLAGNATEKAVQLAAWLASHMDLWPQTRAADSPAEPETRFVLADDSGLEVDALGGAPGVHSARFASLDAVSAVNATDAENNAKLLRLLLHVPPEKRTARFRCVIALTPLPPISAGLAASPAGEKDLRARTELYEGICYGHITLEPKGQAGFGYDPLFIPEERERTFAELEQQEKNRISHRARALQKLRHRLLESR